MAPISGLVAAVLAVAALPAAALALTAQTLASAPVPPIARGATLDSVQRVEVPTEDKRVLVGSYWGPKDHKGAVPAALLVHDAGAQRGDLLEIGERLSKQGFAVLAIDLRGHGESLGKETPFAELSAEDQGKAWTYALRDVKACTSWIGKQPGVHSSNVSLVGDRAGCTLVARYASRDENVRSLVLLDPQVEQFGFNLARDIAALAGLPTYIAATKETETKAQSIADSGERANDGNKFVEIAVFKGVAVMPAPDKSMIVGIAKFMSSKAMPKKVDK